MDRSNIWRGMESLCEAAGVEPQKVFPHNLSHLFAVLFYRSEKDIAKLADLLGHANITMTPDYYAHVDACSVKAEMERLAA